MNLVPSGSSFLQWEEHHFRTQRAPGSTFTFTIVSDSHLGQYGGQTTDELALYKQTLQNIEQDNPDFHIDLGDTNHEDYYSWQWGARVLRKEIWWSGNQLPVHYSRQKRK